MAELQNPFYLGQITVFEFAKVKFNKKAGCADNIDVIVLLLNGPSHLEFSSVYPRTLNWLALNGRSVYSV